MKKTKQEVIIFSIIFVFFLIYSLLLILPLGFAINASLKLNGRTFIKDMTSLATEFNIDNYRQAFIQLQLGKVSFFNMITNSVIFSVGTTFMAIMSSAFLAYAIARYEFKLKKYLYALALFIMMVPIYGSLPASYRLMKLIRFTNSWLFLLSTGNAFGFNFLIIYSFFQAQSREYAEAAFIDGAGHFTVYFKIMFPMAWPSIMAIVITSFIGHWNDYMTPLLYFGNMPTLSSGLWLYHWKIQYSANDPVYFAGAIMSLIPIMTLFICFQNTIMQKVYTGGLKG